MTTVAIREGAGATGLYEFQASAGTRSARGRTAGEALDALLADTITAPTAVLIARCGPDTFFTQAQHDRMGDLLSRKASLSREERAELEALLDAELDATVARTEAVITPTMP